MSPDGLGERLGPARGAEVQGHLLGTGGGRARPDGLVVGEHFTRQHHRAVDGAPAARFLQDLTKALENFSLFLLK